jgi:hypothetical protein
MSRARLRSRHLGSFAAVAVVALLASGIPRGAFAQTQPAAPAQASAPASGGMGGVNFDIGALIRSPLGAWSDYTMAKTGSDKSVTIRYALVDKGPQKLGLEIDTPTPKGAIVMRFDFAGQADVWKLAGGKMQRGTESMDLPKDQLDATPPLKKGAALGDFVANESLTIPAGTFACKHFRSKVVPDDPKSPVMDLWVSDKVAPTGLVKSELSPMGITMQLAGSGVGQAPKTK